MRSAFVAPLLWLLSPHDKSHLFARRRDLDDEDEEGVDLRADVDVEKLVRIHALAQEAVSFCTPNKVGIFTKSELECCAVASAGVSVFVVSSEREANQIEASLPSIATLISLGQGGDFSVRRMNHQSNDEKNSLKLSKMSTSRANFLASKNNQPSSQKKRSKTRHLLDWRGEPDVSITDFAGLFLRDESQTTLQRAIDFLLESSSSTSLSSNKAPFVLAAPIAAFQHITSLTDSITFYCLLDLDKPPAFLTQKLAEKEQDLLTNFFGDEEEDDDIYLRRFK